MKALVRCVPTSMPDNAISIEKPNEKINLDMVKYEHYNYIKLLQELLGINNVIILDTDESLPDCCFVEDPVIFLHLFHHK